MKLDKVNSLACVDVKKVTGCVRLEFRTALFWKYKWQGSHQPKDGVKSCGTNAITKGEKVESRLVMGGREFLP